jgi:AbrB family looped-hinge helix DNA binding protein
MVYGMKTTIPVDRAGRLVLPKAIRSRMRLCPEESLEAELCGDEVILRRLIAQPARVVQENGRVVWDAPDAVATVEDIEQTLVRAREERDQRASGL